MKVIQINNITPEELHELVSKAVGEAMQSQLHVETEQKAVRYLTREETASRLRISLPTLHDYTKSGKVRAFKIGGRVLYREDEVDDSLIEKESLR